MLPGSKAAAPLGRRPWLARAKSRVSLPIETARDLVGAQSARRHALEMYLEALRAGAKRDPELVLSVRRLWQQLGDAPNAEDESLLAGA